MSALQLFGLLHQFEDDLRDFLDFIIEVKVVTDFLDSVEAATQRPVNPVIADSHVPPGQRGVSACRGNHGVQALSFEESVIGAAYTLGVVCACTCAFLREVPPLWSVVNDAAGSHEAAVAANYGAFLDVHDEVLGVLAVATGGEYHYQTWLVGQ